MSLLAQLNSLADADLDNQRVFLRADLDAPLRDGVVADDVRIVAAAVTIRALLAAGARVIVGSRFGEYQDGAGSGPEGSKAKSIEPAAQRLSELLGLDVLLPDGCTGDSVKRVVTSMREGQVCVLENLAFEEDCGAGREILARRLMDHVDMYVGDSLRALSLDSATTTVLPKLMERRVAGPNVLSELHSLARIRGRADEPRLLVWGAPSFEADLPLVMKLLGDSDRLFLVGVAANTMLRAQGGRLGRSKVEEGYLAGARTLAEKLGDRLVLPLDLRVGEGPRSLSPQIVPAGDVPATLTAMDVGPDTEKLFVQEIARAKAVVWIGSVGLHWAPAFSSGTKALTHALANAEAFTVLAGDDSVGGARATDVEAAKKIDCLAQGGPATLALLNGNKLLGLEALRGSVT